MLEVDLGGGGECFWLQMENNFPKLGQAIRGEQDVRASAERGWLGRAFRVGRDWEACEGEGAGWEPGAMAAHRGMSGLALASLCSSQQRGGCRHLSWLGLHSSTPRPPALQWCPKILLEASLPACGGKLHQGILGLG